jgi:segregation and condensation protein A
MQTDFVVQSSSFEGPLDTLLSLIEKRKLYINDISLAKVTADYIEFIKNHQETMESQTEFVGIASTLILAKSKSLLPEKVTEDEENEIHELEDRLRAYKLMKTQSREFIDNFGRQPLFRPRKAPADLLPSEGIFAPGSGLTASQLSAGAMRAVVLLPEDSLPTAQIERMVSLKDEISRLKERCRSIGRLSFSAARRSDNKRDQVVLFVAVLELVRLGAVEAKQEGIFDEITIHHVSEKNRYDRITDSKN